MQRNNLVFHAGVFRAPVARANSVGNAGNEAVTKYFPVQFMLAQSYPMGCIMMFTKMMATAIRV
jgi:hypothetical protein